MNDKTLPPVTEPPVTEPQTADARATGAAAPNSVAADQPAMSTAESSEPAASPDTGSAPREAGVRRRRRRTPKRYRRLQQSHTLRDGGMRRLLASRVAVFGAGNIGSRLVFELVMAGIQVDVYDFDITEAENLGTQGGRVGQPKVRTIESACRRIRPDGVRPFQMDVLHAGPGQLELADVWVDCTDDPGLAVPLTLLSNGAGRPLLRVALDGSGEQELVRLLCSHGSAGHSCQLCTYDLDQFTQPVKSMECPQAGATATGNEETAATRAGGAIGAVAAGMAALHVQRLLTGNDVDQVLDRQWVLDLSHGQLLGLTRTRSDGCLSGHKAWEREALAVTADRLTFGELHELASERLGSRDVVLEVFLHPLCTAAWCNGCNRMIPSAGSPYVPGPACPGCNRPTTWMEEQQRERWTADDLRTWELEQRTLASCGMPAHGALVVARAAGQRPVRLQLPTNLESPS